MKKKTVAETKRDMGFNKKGPVCSNCTYFTMDVVVEKTQHGEYSRNKNKRCGFGFFATGLSSWCKHHVRVEE